MNSLAQDIYFRAQLIESEMQRYCYLNEACAFDFALRMEVEDLLDKAGLADRYFGDPTIRTPERPDFYKQAPPQPHLIR